LSAENELAREPVPEPKDLLFCGVGDRSGTRAAGCTAESRSLDFARDDRVEGAMKNKNLAQNTKSPIS